MAKRCLWRITHKSQGQGAFSGKGAAKYGGRWNDKGTPLVYTAESLAGAMVELLAYYKDVRTLEARVYFRVDADEELILSLDPNALPGDWRTFPYPPSTQKIGTLWHQEAPSVGLRVPSVLIPETYNVLLNPEHPEFHRVTIDGPYPLAVDGRLADLVEAARGYEGG